jgi:hypothetical protein
LDKIIKFKTKITEEILKRDDQATVQFSDFEKNPQEPGMLYWQVLIKSDLEGPSLWTCNYNPKNEDWGFIRVYK